MFALRAARAYAAMQDEFQRTSGLYRRDGRLRMPRSVAHLWPFSQALVATLTLAGVDRGLIAFDADGAIADRLAVLERYYDVTGGQPAYSSDVLGTRRGGDRYHDDNAWIGLALIQLERMRPGSGYLRRAQELFWFATGGWDSSGSDPSPGGVFWVEQGRGLGVRNHDRNTVSTAPNAELGFHLAELRVAPAAGGSVGPEQMYEWVLATLDASRGGQDPGTGLFWDKLRGDGTLDKAVWSYNQGSMIGATVLLGRRGGPERDGLLARAEEIARKALRHFAGGWERQPPAFNAIFFRNLLLLHGATDDAQLPDEIIEAIRAYVDYAWYERRDHHDRFHLTDGGVTLLNQSAIVQLLALLAWDPAGYLNLA